MNTVVTFDGETQTCVEEIYDIFAAQGSERLCELRCLYSHSFDDGELYSGVVDFEIKSQWANEHFDIDWMRHNDRVDVFIQDMFLVEPIRGLGIGTFIWSLIYKNLHSQVRDRFFIAGKLTERDYSEGRDRFWQRIIGFDKNAPHSRFKTDNNGFGRFSGRLQSNLPLSDKITPLIRTVPV